ncbi:unnamed protein product [Dicrocoelium dendriticum]|nr:unnamed protein product [Dicrocoelium dendriticum]
MTGTRQHRPTSAPLYNALAGDRMSPHREDLNGANGSGASAVACRDGEPCLGADGAFLKGNHYAAPVHRKSSEVPPPERPTTMAAGRQQNPGNPRPLYHVSGRRHLSARLARDTLRPLKGVCPLTTPLPYPPPRGVPRT